LGLREIKIVDRCLLPLCLLALLGWKVASAQVGAKDTTSSWRGEWGVEEGLALSLDTEGYQLPTAIAFVPRPGTGPKDPLYFVTELRGKVKVVTNDRSVYTFAEDFFQTRPLKELPEFAGETGLAGICLAPKQGYVFVTFAYRVAPQGADSIAAGQPRMGSHRATSVRSAAGALRNNIVRFKVAPQTFSLKPTGHLAFTELFAGYEAAVSHQIGACQVVGDVLYVSVADGWQTAQSQQVNSLLGKVLRMSLDGQPAPGNPFYQVGDDRTAADFVWAYGLRNPFSLKAVGNRLFVADNGLRLDRFLEVRAGENYLWDGSDWSIGARADLTLSPDVGPAQLEYYSGGPLLPEKYGQSFFVAASSPDRPGVLRLGYRLQEGKARSVPQYVLRYRGSGAQIVTGVALGPDGLYFVPTLPDAEGRSGVFKVSYRPDQPHPFLLTHAAEPEALMEERGCFGCHQIGGIGGAIGPSLDRRPMVERLESRLESKAYAQTLTALDRLEEEPFRRFRAARAEVLQASGSEKVRTWMIYRLREPKFDNPDAQMPNLGLSGAEATIITDHLLRREPWPDRAKEAVLRLLPPAIRPEPLLYRHLLLAFGGGLVIGVSLFTLLPRAMVRLRRARHGETVKGSEH
jgi:hypothetical protein